MPGQPQLREAGRLYAPDGSWIAAVVRLEQRMDGSGTWVVLLNSPAEVQEPTRWEFPDEASARRKLAGIYREGREKGGRWETYVPTTDWP
ncbi:hypothetical protein [Micromonospora sp. L32]|uniref:hypothetical protein n=1 Tax=Micromonospora sp. L32 TaxID=3452214 RepID=UPI003F89EFD6